MPKKSEAPRRRVGQVTAKLVPLGVDIIDRNGEVLAGISDEDATHLLASLAKQLPKIALRLTWADDIPF